MTSTTEPMLVDWVKALQVHQPEDAELLESLCGKLADHERALLYSVLDSVYHLGNMDGFNEGLLK